MEESHLNVYCGRSESEKGPNSASDSVTALAMAILWRLQDRCLPAAVGWEEMERQNTRCILGIKKMTCPCYIEK